ncbi:hypothetical protein [Streptosporangium sp. CA-115845]|uniref:hypothetical protein n=1 Tax=Streptosporangium sp. CA-115845 TaxID=3240071 RepID=UPI003D8EABC2
MNYDPARASPFCHARKSVNRTQEELAEDLWALAQQMYRQGAIKTLPKFSVRQLGRWEGPNPSRPRPAAAAVLERYFKVTIEELGLNSSFRDESLIQEGRAQGVMATLLPSPPIDAKNPHLIAIESFRRADRQLGGGHVYHSVLRYLLHTIAPGLFGADRQHNGNDAFRSAAVLTEMAAWMAHDSGRDDLARKHFAKALQLARTVSDTSVGANILAGMSHLALQSNQPDEAAALARAGQDRIKVGGQVPMLSSRLHAMEARAQARLGNTHTAQRALAAARKQLERTSQEVLPYWVAPFDEAALSSETVLCLQDLDMLPAATAEAQRAVSLRSEERARSRAFSQISLALLLVQQQELDAACSLGHTLLSSCQILGSSRVTQRLNDLALTLIPHRGVQAVNALLDDLTAVNQQRTSLLASLSPASSGGDQR